MARSPAEGSKRRTCVLTIQADRPGGVPTVIDWWHRFLTEWGHEATSLYAPFEPYVARFSLWERLVHTVRTWRTHPRPDHPRPTLANAPPPVPLWLFYFMPQWILGRVLDLYDQFVVAGGPCLMALPLALRQKSFILWIGTLYEDELRGKALTGDRWAQQVLNGRFWKLLQWQERFVLRRATRILAQSPYTARRIVEAVPEVKGRLQLVMIPIDTDTFFPLEGKERALPGPILLSVGRINDPRKNAPMLLRAFATVRKSIPDASLILAGEEPSADLRALCDSLRLQDSVIFRGTVSREELVTLYQCADVFLLASTQEGLGIVLLESMACGTPIIATDCGGPEGIVVDGVTGSIAANNDDEAFAHSVVSLLQDLPSLRAMRKNCVRFIEEHCTRDKVEEEIYHSFVEVFPDSHAAHHAVSGD